jgi:hypothetical protein
VHVHLLKCVDTVFVVSFIIGAAQPPSKQMVGPSKLFRCNLDEYKPSSVSQRMTRKFDAFSPGDGDAEN